MNRIGVAFCFLFLLPLSCFGQRLLDQKITLEVRDSPVAGLLDNIQEQGGFYFVYNPNDFSPDSLVNVSIVNTSVRQVLTGLFQDDFNFKEYGDHVLIFRKRKPPKKTPGKRVISGYVVNLETREFIQSASISELDKLGSTFTDDNGYYELEVPSDLRSVALAVGKAGYADTLLVIDSKTEVLEVAIRPTDVDDYFKGLEKYGMVKLMTSSSHLGHSRNYSRSIQRVAQLSFVPYLGTNHRLSGIATNNLSVNVLAGYSYATRGVEIGGLSNIDRMGFDGVQLAGISNHCGQYANGLQAAGIVNIVTGDVTGVQIGGINNNIHGNLKGWQVGGINNIVTGGGNGFQVGGVSNFSLSDYRGSQIAGVVNYARRNKTMQLAGVVNISTQGNSGVQIAGVLNVADKLDGAQIGLINLADSATGVPIGLFSFVRKGHISLGLTFDETLFSTVAFKTGVPGFHNIFQVSADPTRSTFSYGAGIGSRLGPPGRNSLYLELTANQVHEGTYVENLNLLSILRLSFHRSWGKWDLLVGPDAKVLLSEWTNPEGQFLSELSPYQIYEEISGLMLIQFWVGGHLGLHYHFNQ